MRDRYFETHDIKPVSSLKQLLVFLFLMLMFSVLVKTSQADESDVRIPGDVKNWSLLKSLEFDYQSITYNYSLAIPKHYKTSKKLPLIVYFHGSGGDDTSDIYFFTKYIDRVVKHCQGNSPMIVFPGNQEKFFVKEQNRIAAVDLINRLSETYPIAGGEQRIIAGYSLGGMTAIRAALVNPEYRLAYSWGGGVWDKDRHLFESVVTNASKLRANQFKAVLINGDQDRPQAFSHLTPILSEQKINYSKIILKEQRHRVQTYLDNSFKRFLSDVCPILKQ